MRKFRCSCGETLYFDSTRCDTCGREAGYCPVCRQVVTLRGHSGGGYTCSNAACGAPLVKCQNFRVHHVCNRCINPPPPPPAPEAQQGTSAQGGVVGPGTLCESCRYTRVIPDLSKPGNLEKWSRLEAAKRRLFYQLDLVNLPRGVAAEGFSPPLSFEFKEDPAPMSGIIGILGEHEVVMTGHLNGRITINICEADPVERERLRVHFGESHRTLIGHFRHEIAHYYWDLLVRGKREPAFKAVFGDHEHPPYAEALRRYYEAGPPDDWRSTYASAYASMHPWEDFAETFAAYIEMVSTLDTAQHTGLNEPVEYTDLDRMVEAYRRLGMAMNEVNRTMGLKDLLARPLSEPVIEKLRFIHQLVREAGQPGAPTSDDN